MLPAEFNKANWGIGDSFINLAAGHHKPETPLQWIIAMADRVSAGFDRDEFEDYNKGINLKDYKKTRLLSIFEGINTKPEGKDRDDHLEDYHYRYPLKELSPASIFPVDISQTNIKDQEETSQDYEKLFFNFIDSLEKLYHRNNIPLWFEHFENLYMIYTSYIPAATVGKVVPDVSLYDHSKATAALASALYLYHKENGTFEIEKIKDYEEKKFLIVTGDFYGIQNFIFSEGGSTNKAAAKLLRGRSFAVSLITELAAEMLCREIGLTPSSIILNAAGKFTLIAPNIAPAQHQINLIGDKINDWLIRMFYGECSMGISYLEASCKDFVSKNFSELWRALFKTLEKKKYCKINLDKYGGTVKEYLGQFNNDLDKKLCPFCGKRPSSLEVENDPVLRNLGKEEKSACTICRDHIFIGTHIVKAPRMAVTTCDADLHGLKLKEPIFGSFQISFDVSGELSSLANKGDLLKYWDISISEDGRVEKETSAKFINTDFKNNSGNYLKM